MNLLESLSNKFGDIWLKFSWKFASTFSKKNEKENDHGPSNSGQIDRGSEEHGDADAERGEDNESQGGL